MIQKIFAALMSFVMTILSFLGISVPSYTIYENVAYGNSQSQVMDIYVPNDAKDNKVNGAVLMLHGGMYKSGSRKDMANRCREIATKGYIAVTMDYSLMSDSTFGKVSAFSLMEEVNLAIQKLKTYSYDNNLNISKLGIFGTGAGGHIALLYAYSRTAYSAIDIGFVAAQAAPTDFDYNIWKDEYPASEMADLVSNLSAVKVTANSITSGAAKDICNRISPVYFINSKTNIPTLLAYGGKDKTVPIGNGESIKAAAENSAIKLEYYDFPNSTNTMSGDALTSAEYNNMLYRYCANYLVEVG